MMCPECGKDTLKISSKDHSEDNWFIEHKIGFRCEECGYEFSDGWVTCDCRGYYED